MFVEIHLLQSFAPSNLNRDDTGSPKECEFGGVRRARISSQCLKRSIRTSSSFASTTRAPVGIRTRLLKRALTERLSAMSLPLEQIDAVLPKFVEQYLSKKGDAKLDKEGRTEVLVYVGNPELDDMARLLAERWAELQDTKLASKAIAQIISALTKSYSVTTSVPDIALFGRMLAGRPEFNLEASCQVAHAVSTHRVAMELDYFTAVDDLLKEEETGAGHINVSGYDSACYYRYMRVDWEHLVQNLDGDAALARRTLEGFIRAAEEAVPSGKQNSFAANNPPSLALAVVREDGMGWNLVNAFERPVRATGDGGYVVPSVAALDAYWGALCDAYGTDTLRCVAARTLGNDLPVQTLAPYLIPGREAWLQTVLSAIPQEA